MIFTYNFFSVIVKHLLQKRHILFSLIYVIYLYVSIFPIFFLILRLNLNLKLCEKLYYFSIELFFLFIS